MESKIYYNKANKEYIDLNTIKSKEDLQNKMLKRIYKPEVLLETEQQFYWRKFKIEYVKLNFFLFPSYIIFTYINHKIREKEFGEKISKFFIKSITFYICFSVSVVGYYTYINYTPKERIIESNINKKSYFDDFFNNQIVKKNSRNLKNFVNKN